MRDRLLIDQQRVSRVVHQDRDLNAIDRLDLDAIHRHLFALMHPGPSRQVEDRQQYCQIARCHFRVEGGVPAESGQALGMDEKQVCRQLADFAIAWRESRRINVEARWKRQTAAERSSYAQPIARRAD
jgi:hypothetical protein